MLAVINEVPLSAPLPLAEPACTTFSFLLDILFSFSLVPVKLRK